MQISKKKLSLFFALLLAVGYLLGLRYPITYVIPGIDPSKRTLSLYELSSLWISGLSAIFTLFAVIVALLKDEITKIWRKAVLTIDSHDSNLLKEKVTEDSGNSVAEYYYIKLHIKNNGSIDARNCRIVITKLIYTNLESRVTRSIDTTRKNIAIEDNESKVLPPLSSIDFQLLTISASTGQSSSSSGTSEVTPTLNIAGTEISRECHRGAIDIYISLHSEGMLPVEKIVSIHWDGQWKHRLSDICPSHLKAEFKPEETSI